MSSKAKKISQSELRKYMNATKRKVSESLKRVESPLAKYSESGVLSCKICCTVISSATEWSSHITTKQHRDNIAGRSQSRGRREELLAVHMNLSQPPANSQLPPVVTSTKKPKGILKNATPLPPKFFDNISGSPELSSSSDDGVPEKKKIKLEGKEATQGLLKSAQTEGNGTTEEAEDEPMDADLPKDTELPEGFFDDPILDAKARNVEYKDPIEEEWERFQKEMKEEKELSAKLIHEDTEDATVQRQIEQIDEQISKLSRVVQLEIKKEEVKTKVLTKREIKKEDPSKEESDDSDIEVEFDWRAKSYLS